ncbi:hypothetical protein FS837_005715, partial [Tulasnella sp. UAMH 9824]
MAQRIPRPSSAPPSSNQPPGLPSDLGGKIHGAGQVVLSILKVTHNTSDFVVHRRSSAGVQDTDWPKQASNDVQDLIRKIEAPLVLDKLPKEETECPDQLKTAIYQLLGQLESVQTRLKGESKKYGTKKKGFRKRVKGFLSRDDPSQCAGVVRSCRDDVVESSTTLNDILNDLGADNKQRSSHAAESTARHDPEGQTGTNATQIASMSDQNAKNGLGMTSVPSNSPLDQSVAQPGQVPSNEDGKQKGSSVRREWLNAANKAFKIAEGVSGALPVVGSYVGAVAKVGLTVVEMVQ